MMKLPAVVAAVQEQALVEPTPVQVFDVVIHLCVGEALD
jgi:hypothetical protein